MMGVARCRLEEAVVEGWCPVEELVRWGFGHAPVVMANEAHSGLTRYIRTRQMGIRMIRAAHQAAVRRLAMEALPWPARDTPGPIRAIPQADRGYLAQPDMQRLIAAALELGWSPWAYEAVFKLTADTDPAKLRSMEFTNWREREQAAKPVPADSGCPSRAATGLVRQQPRQQEASQQGESRRLGSHGLALPRHVRYRPVRHRPDRDRHLPGPASAVGAGTAGRTR
jgi:hypothetical protein